MVYVFAVTDPSFTFSDHLPAGSITFGPLFLYGGFAIVLLLFFIVSDITGGARNFLTLQNFSTSLKPGELGISSSTP
jgi:hypothetical protein